MDKLIEYLDSLKDDGRYPRRRDWMFGALDFAVGAGIITGEEYNRLMKEYDLGE